MSIITPAFPSLNAARSVFRTTKAAIRGEIKRASLLIDNSSVPATSSAEALKQEDKMWVELLKPYRFFSKFGSFLEIKVLSKQETEHPAWRGFVESRLRYLIHYLEEIQALRIRAWPREFTLAVCGDWKCVSAYYLGILIVEENIEGSCERIDMRPSVSHFYGLLHTWLMDKYGVEGEQRLNVSLQYLERDAVPACALRLEKAQERAVKPSLFFRNEFF